MVASYVLDQHLQTASHAERSIDSCRRMHTSIQHLHDKTPTLIHEHLQLHASQYKHITHHPSHPLHKHTPYFNTPRLKTHYILQGPLQNKPSLRPHKVTTTDIKTNMRHIHTSIVSRHLATTGNNKILCTVFLLSQILISLLLTHFLIFSYAIIYGRR